MALHTIRICTTNLSQEIGGLKYSVLVFECESVVSPPEEKGEMKDVKLQPHQYKANYEYSQITRKI